MKRRNAIIRTAIETINSKSFALATMSEIAAQLDLRDAALYYYFADKQSLGFACHMQSLQRLQDLLGDADQSGGSGFDKLQRFIEGMLQDAVRNGPQLYLGDVSYLSDPQRERVNTWLNVLKARVETYLRDGIADGTIIECEVELVVQLVLGMLIWLAKWTAAIPDLTVERLMSAIGAVSFRGLANRT